MPAGTFVGFGFGPIQAGLMLCEAHDSGNFSRFVVAEVDPALVDAVRGNGDAVTINIAGETGIRRKILPDVRLLNPKVGADRKEIVAAIGSAAELATAIPSVELYGAGGDASVAALLAEGAVGGRARIIYAAENNNYAAELLMRQVIRRAPREGFSRVQALDTVIGKMSGVVSSPEEMRRLGLAPLVPGLEKCILVEEFNRILISRIALPGFTRGIRVFEEKEDLIPFEEAKLYGHNAVHALLGYLARLRGHRVMSSIREDAELLALGRRAFLQESGAALIHRHGRTGDPLFTAAGYEAYADDLLLRMTNPFLQDDVDRIIRDPKRKLGWSDRFFGTMRAALEAGIEPTAMALGAAAATDCSMEGGARGGAAAARDHLLTLWGSEAAGEQRDVCLSLVQDSFSRLDAWRS
jgi:mannitol-1-phosphate 5-dehydrogenase